MDESIQLILRKIIALGTAVMMVVTLAAIAVVKADHDKGKAQNVASGNNAGSSSDIAAGSDQGGGGGGDTGAQAQGANGSTGPAAGAASGNSAAGAGGTAGKNSAAGPSGAGATGGCKDANPDEGVFCDHFLAGGTTVLSGPLAVYGDQGLKGGLAWLTYYNTEVAPKEHLRQGKLIWYDDSLDPQKTLQYVQRLHDVDKVLYLGGVTSPEAISAYLQQTQFPMIGDIGLSPKSWTNRYIFPTAPSQDIRDPLRIHIAVDRFHIKSFAVIEDVLPSVNTDPDKKAWKSAERFGAKELDYVEIASTASDCSAQFNRIIQSKPEYIILPTASGAMLACLREARKFSVQPNGPNSSWLKGWSGGSNLQLEVDSCKPTCEGMYSIGTIFNDPRVSTTPQMQTYRANMAKYAPNVDITGFIAINYYHAGYLFYQLTKTAGIQNNLSRKTIVDAAEHFGPFDTGFGNTVQWTTQVPREPWNCGYPVVVKGDKWVFDTQKYCI